MSVKVKGRIVSVLPETTGVSKSGSAWRKREYVMVTGAGKFPKEIFFSVMNDNIEKCNLQLHEEVEVCLDIESREYNGKWYTSCSAWAATRIAASSMYPQAQYPLPPHPGGYTPQHPTPSKPYPNSDLPF